MRSRRQRSLGWRNLWIKEGILSKEEKAKFTRKGVGGQECSHTENADLGIRLRDSLHHHHHRRASPFRSKRIHTAGQVTLANKNGHWLACFFATCRKAAPTRSPHEDHGLQPNDGFVLLEIGCRCRRVEARCYHPAVPVAQSLWLLHMMVQTLPSHGPGGLQQCARTIRGRRSVLRRRVRQIYGCVF